MTDSPPDVFVAEPGRFHLYAAWSSALAHRSTLVIALAGLSDVISVSYVDPIRPAARERRLGTMRNGVQIDKIPGLQLAYDVTDPQFAGAVTVPTLWDTDSRRVVTNDYPTLEIDLATEFREWSSTGVELYPQDLQDEIDDLDSWLAPAVDHGPSRVGGGGGEAGRQARARLNQAFGTLDRQLSDSRYLLGDRITLADLRLWVTLARFGAGSDPRRRIAPELSRFSSLWAYAQSLYELDAFRATTEPTTFTVPNLG